MNHQIFQPTHRRTECLVLCAAARRTRNRRPRLERGALDVADVGLAVDQLLLVVITEALTRAAYGRRTLTEAEAGQIVDNGVQMWLRCYRPIRSP
jgi:AefR-like transcriptional repressor, C-terminal domain